LANNEIVIPRTTCAALARHDAVVADSSGSSGTRRLRGVTPV